MYKRLMIFMSVLLLLRMRISIHTKKLFTTFHIFSPIFVGKSHNIFCSHSSMNLPHTRKIDTRLLLLRKKSVKANNLLLDTVTIKRKSEKTHKSQLFFCWNSFHGINPTKRQSDAYIINEYMKTIHFHNVSKKLLYFVCKVIKNRQKTMRTFSDDDNHDH